MTTDDKIRDGKLQYINREATKLLALSSNEIDINILQLKKLPPDQSRMIEQAKFTYFLLGKAFEK